jgi:hypothetical protein
VLAPVQGGIGWKREDKVKSPVTRKILEDFSVNSKRKLSSLSSRRYSPWIFGRRRGKKNLVY